MITLIEQIKHGQIWDFHGGVHPPENKHQSNQQTIQSAEIPSEIVLPLKQHIGTTGQLLVSVGDKVLKGQPLTKSDVLQACPVHAPTSGEVVAIEARTIAHPSGLTDNCIVIRPDFEDTWAEKSSVDDYLSKSPEDLIDHIRLMGIAGMGGAGFPAARKLQTAHNRTEILILNGAECEPYITADDRLMQERADEIVQGAEILKHIVNPKLTVVALEDNKPEAIEALKTAVMGKDDILVQVVPTKYPSGGEKQLIKLVTGKEVPTKAIPAAIGIMVQNVGTAFAIKRAVIDGEPLIERVVTLTGTTLKEQSNRWALLGTPISFLLDKHGYQPDKKLERVIIGGPMMGFTAPHTQIPVTKVTNCILVPSKREIEPSHGEMACIRCSSCAEACPASLLPQQLQWYAKDQNYDKCEEYNLFDCIECGACAYVCPSEIPLVQYYRQAKAEIRTRDAEHQSAERARERFEAKKARLERDKKEREARHKQAAENRRKAMEKSGDGDAIAAAIARVKAKGEQGSAVAAIKPAVAAAIAKAKAKQAEAAVAGSSEPDNSEMSKLREERKRLARERKAQKEATTDTSPSDSTTDKKDAVAAAIARAKAKKAAQQADAPTSESSEGDAKKAAVAAAIARAKARKAEHAESVEPTENASSDADPKKAAVAAAVARAKARKASQQVDSQDTADVVVPSENDPKKAAVAAAVARAKARKTAQQAEAQDTADMVESSQEDPKKAAVAAAVARAKARKASQQAEAQDTADVVESSEEDPKKAAVAAAVARAKARKAAQQAEAQDTADVVDPSIEEDPKKAAVAAAVARAKARKAAQQAESKQLQSENTEVQAPLIEEPSAEEPVIEDPKKAAVAAAVARAKARKAAQMQNKNEDE
ncbi:electron transport complex subunit RsxC [Enterovibrio sp. ZSDZ35]|uniref:Ion-translocating oxidoreductase complex subunit C n=1 Tax=Enterovibrio qingdaonensis TaxID=2899818 RepID=A0ABT5QKU2_9GAMM|nr:electron transport complex subunit RsxC [Enterovibrio sp. ZSDZ35]MDD1781293.1 electron transport complex subunit RsxC [Enterovibrio sp. ZSDZ35]